MGTELVGGEGRFSGGLCACSGRHSLGRFHHRLSAVSERIDESALDLAAAPFVEGFVDAFDYGLERNGRALPVFDKRPIKRRQQKQAGTARTLEMIFNLCEVVEIGPRPIQVFGSTGNSTFAHGSDR